MPDAFEPDLNPFGVTGRLRRVRVIWLPILLVLLDGLLLLFLTALALLLTPFVLLATGAIWLLRLLASLAPQTRWLARQRREVYQRPPAGTGSLSDEQRRQVALAFRPCLVIYPEAADLGPPYRVDDLVHMVGADYHPRDVRLFLNHARLRRGRTQWLPELPDLTDSEEIRASLGEPGEQQSSLESPWLHGGNPFRIFRHLLPVGRQFHTHRAIPVPTGDCGCSVGAWERYTHIVGRDAGRPSTEQRYPHTLYARVLEGRELPEIGLDHPLRDAIVVQYWWFLFYNDAWNRHQGDWEGVTVFLRRDGDAVTPLGAAYASHDLGRWRRWRDVQRVDGNGDEADEGSHPVVYVARGSHASYFDYSETGYHPQMVRKLRLPLLGEFNIPAQFVLESRVATDWVATDAPGRGNGVRVFTENVKVMPPEAVLRDLARLKEDDDWWWLAYRGLWGAPEFLPFFGGSGPRGPQWQGIKWDDPFRWVMRHCIADEMPYWLEMFSDWEPAGLLWDRDVAGGDEQPAAETVVLAEGAASAGA